MMDAGYGLEMITTIGYVAGSDNQASLKVNSAAGFLGAVARVLCGAARVLCGAARKLFSLKAFRAARLKTPAARRLIVSAVVGWQRVSSRCFSGGTTLRLAVRRHDTAASPSVLLVCYGR